jgi:hypothetical protein
MRRSFRFAADTPARYNFPSFGDVAQLGERGVRNAEVEGSIPFVSTNPAKPAANRRLLSSGMVAA